MSFALFDDLDKTLVDNLVKRGFSTDPKVEVESTNNDVKIKASAESAKGVASAKAELTYTYKDFKLTEDIDTNDAKHAKVEYTGVKDVVLSLSGAHKDAKKGDNILLGAQYNHKYGNANVTLDLLHRTGAHHEVNASFVAGDSGCGFFAGAAVKLWPTTVKDSKDEKADDAATDAKDEVKVLQDYRFAAGYQNKTQLLVARADEKFHVFSAGYQHAINASITAMGSVKYTRGQESKKPEVEFGVIKKDGARVVKAKINQNGIVSASLANAFDSNTTVTFVGKVDAWNMENLSVGAQISFK